MLHNFENEHSSGELVKQRVIEALRNGESEAEKLLMQWIEKRQAEAEKINTPRANVEFDIELGEMYIAQGLLHQAWDHLQTSLMQAQQEGFDDLADKINSVMDDLDRMIEDQN
jgi:predicted deacetylase